MTILEFRCGSAAVAGSGDACVSAILSVVAVGLGSPSSVIVVVVVIVVVMAMVGSGRSSVLVHVICY